MAAAIRARPSGAATTRAAPARTETGKAHSWKTPRSFGLTFAIASLAFSRAVAIASVAFPRAVAIASMAPSRACAAAAEAFSRAVAIASPARSACLRRSSTIATQGNHPGRSVGREWPGGEVAAPAAAQAFESRRPAEASCPAVRRERLGRTLSSNRAERTLHIVFPLTASPYLVHLPK